MADVKESGAAGAAATGAAGAGADNAAAGAAGADKAASGTIADAGAAAGGDKIAAAGAAASGAAAAAGADKAGAAAGAGAAGADKGAAAEPDWRTRLAGDDKELAKTLARYTDEAAFGKAHRALLSKMSSGELKKALPEGATPEEKATWRKENGIPENEVGYVEQLALPNGLVLGEADKPIVAEFAKAALEGNVDPKQFNGLVAKYYAIQDQQRAALEVADATFKQQSEDALRDVWKGPEFRQNLTAIQNMMAGWPEGLATRVLAGRTPDGRKLGDDPAFVRQLAGLARELNPAATLVPAGTTDANKGVADRLAEIRKFRSDNPDKYDSDKKMQAEELALIDAELTIKKRSA